MSSTRLSLSQQQLTANKKTFNELIKRNALPNKMGKLPKKSREEEDKKLWNEVSKKYISPYSKENKLNRDYLILLMMVKNLERMNSTQSLKKKSNLEKRVKVTEQQNVTTGTFTIIRRGRKALQKKYTVSH